MRVIDSQSFSTEQCHPERSEGYARDEIPRRAQENTRFDLELEMRAALMFTSTPNDDSFR